MAHRLDLDVICGMYRLDPYRLADTVVAYHITHRCNLPGIQASGLKAQPCQATTFGPERRPAVYLFALKRDAQDGNIRRFLFGDDTDDLAVVKVTIPLRYFTNMHEDGLFSMSAQAADGSYPYAIQYTGDIPAGWIEIA